MKTLVLGQLEKSIDRVEGQKNYQLGEQEFFSWLSAVLVTSILALLLPIFVTPLRT